MDRAVSAPGGASDQRILRFGHFELDLHTRELRRAGMLVKIQHQPFKVLALLAARAGELVTRDELREQIWGGDTYVDFDQGLNFCIKQIRSALGDQADTPRYVETLPRRGYRFIAPIESQPRPHPIDSVRLIATEPDAAPAPLPFRTTAEPRRRAEAEHPSGGRRRAAWIAAGIAAAAALTLGGFWIGRAASDAHEAPSFQRLTFGRGLVDGARFTEGGEVVYAAAWEGRLPELFVTRVGQADTRTLGSEALLLAGAAGSEAAVRHLGDGKRGVLARMPLAGGPARDIAENVLAADWSRDGRVFAAVRLQDGIPRLEMPLGNALQGALSGDVIWMRLSPGGDRLAFLEHPVPGDDQGSVVTVDSEGRRRVLSSGWASIEGLAWSPSGREVWFTGTRLGADSALWAVDLQGRERLVYRGPGRLVLHDVEAGGRALLSRKSLRMEIRARLAEEAAEHDVGWFDVPFLTDITADGRGVVFGESGVAGGRGYSIFLRTGTAPPVRLGGGRPFTLSPDGKWLASIPVTPPFNVVLIPTGAGEPRVIRMDGLPNVYQVGWLPDGSGLVLAGRQADRPQRIFVQPLNGGAPRPVTPERVTARQIVVSPDGRWVVGVERGKGPVLYPLSGGGDPRPIAGAEPEDQPLQWSDDGRTLYLQRGRLPMLVYAVDLASGTRRPWRELAPDDRAGVLTLTRIVLTRDARAYAFGYGRVLSELYLVDGLR
jgi:DNA-binding winged helix-turn-helix (wHTH) protein